jgi:hypothetical protein
MLPGSPVGRTNISEESIAPIFSVDYYSEDGGSRFLRNLRNHLQDYAVSQPRVPQSQSILFCINIQA